MSVVGSRFVVECALLRMTSHDCDGFFLQQFTVHTSPVHFWALQFTAACVHAHSSFFFSFSKALCLLLCNCHLCFLFPSVAAGCWAPQVRWGNQVAVADPVIKGVDAVWLSSNISQFWVDADWCVLVLVCACSSGWTRTGVCCLCTCTDSRSARLLVTHCAFRTFACLFRFHSFCVFFDTCVAVVFSRVCMLLTCGLYTLVWCPKNLGKMTKDCVFVSPMLHAALTT